MSGCLTIAISYAKTIAGHCSAQPSRIVPSCHSDAVFFKRLALRGISPPPPPTENIHLTYFWNNDILQDFGGGLSPSVLPQCSPPVFSRPPFQSVVKTIQACRTRLYIFVRIACIFNRSRVVANHLTIRPCTVYCKGWIMVEQGIGVG